MKKEETRRFLRFFIKDIIWFVGYYPILRESLKERGIICDKPYKFTRWHSGFCYYLGNKSGERVFIKTCMDKYDTIDNEIKMGRISNRHIPRVIDYNKDGIRYVVNNFIEDARDINSLSHEELVRQSCEILDGLFDAGIVNRDVNHENLMVDNQGVLMLIDFGWAVFADQEFVRSDYDNIESMLNKRYRQKDHSFDDAYSFYEVLKNYCHIEEAELVEIKSRIGRLRVEGR